jgi:hypothetical protein
VSFFAKGAEPAAQKASPILVIALAFVVGVLIGLALG